MQINIPQRLKDLRTRHGDSQGQVASFLQMSAGKYGHYETGRAEPSLETLISLTDYYGFSTIDELLGISPEKKAQQNKVVQAYHSADPEKRRIVDFILNLNC